MTKTKGSFHAQFGVPSNVGVANVEGASALFVRQDHVHNHAAGLGFSLHHEHYLRLLHSVYANPQAGRAAVVGRVYLIPVQVPFRLTVDRLGIVWEAIAIDGNIILGIYADNGDTPVGGAVIAETASTPNSGSAGGGYTTQEIAITDLQLEPDLYWFASEHSVINNYYGIGGSAALAGTLVGGNGTLAGYYYNRGGGYGALTNPCPAVTIFKDVAYQFARVKSVP